jgi:hypothetical protein
MLHKIRDSIIDSPLDEELLANALKQMTSNHRFYILSF